MVRLPTHLEVGKVPSFRLNIVALVAALAAAPLPVAIAETPVASFSEEKAGFTVQFKDLATSYKVVGTYVLPGETLTIAATGPAGGYRLDAKDGQATKSAAATWQWQAPEKAGLYPLTVRRAGSRDTITLNVFVMVPYARMRHGAINGYRIGAYPDRAPTHPEVYKKPAGFIEVTAENENTFIAPHFRLKQFLCKEKGGYPKYVVLQEKLLLKLELLLAKANEKSFRANTFTVMSGYRTPAYNSDLGNVKFSAHQYGMAADVYIDSANSGAMDDLNRDGRIDYHDAEALYDVADRLHVEPDGARLVGGLGKYRPTRAHGPFVHVDVRGFKARWSRS